MRPRLNEAPPGPAPRASSPAWAIEDQAWRLGRGLRAAVTARTRRRQARG